MQLAKGSPASGLEAKRLPYLVERLGVRRAVIYAAESDNAVEEVDSGVTEPRDSDVFSELVQVFPVDDGVDPCAVDIWDLAPGEEGEATRAMLTDGLSTILVGDIHRFDRYVALLLTLQQAIVIELVAREILRLVPAGRIAVFSAVDAPAGEFVWGATPEIVSNPLPADIASYDDWMEVAYQYGKVLTPDSDLYLVVSQYLVRIIEPPETDEDILVIDLTTKRRIVEA